MSDYLAQKPTQICLTDSDVVAAFGNSRAPDEFKSSFDEKVQIFGNPLLESFAADYLVTRTLPGFHRPNNKELTVSVNCKLADIFVAAFERLKAENLSYTLYEGGTYCFRYQQNIHVKAAIANRPEYEELRKKPDFWKGWNQVCAEQDRRLNAFDEKIPYKNGSCAKKHLLSNHSFGSAIDINPNTNPYDNKKEFDMPRRVVEILEGFGFHWGGYYHDYMHFEYLRARIVGALDEEPAQVFFPLGEGLRRESPLKYYFINERGAGGYFPLGMQQNLHGGVHLEPESSDLVTVREPVRAAMPGYIVAARLMAPGKGGDNDTLRDVVEGRHLGFVLLRHEVLPLDEKSDPSATGGGGAEPQKPKAHPLYSLYMHLAPPSWTQGDDGFEEIPWLESFLKMRFGGVVNLDPRSPDVGKTFWAREAPKPDATSFAVADRQEPLAARHGTRTLALSKPSPEAVSQAIQAFQDGAIVTFDRPLFPVEAGELIGFVAEGELTTQGIEFDEPPRYLHWQIFSNAGSDGGIEVLRHKAGELQQLLKYVKQIREDNFLAMPSGADDQSENEIKKLLGEVGEKLVEKLIGAGYDCQLQSELNDGKTFFKSDDTGAAPFTYPLELTLDNKYGYQGEPGGGTCTLEVSYRTAGVLLGEPERITFNPGQGKVELKVPAEADELRLWSPHFFLDQPSVDVETLRKERLASRMALFKAAVPRRWRNVVLEHMNEWTPKGLAAQLEARWKAGLLRHFIDDEDEEAFKKLKVDLRPLSWWARHKDADDPFGEVPVLGTHSEEKSIFGAGDPLLPEDAKVVDMHPVTALWLIDILAEKKVLGFRREWPPGTLKRDESTQKPLFLGLLWAEDAPRCGMALHSVLIQHGYGTTDGEKGTDVTFWVQPTGGTGGGAPLMLGRARYDNGVALQHVSFSFWGGWEVYATDGQGQRFEPVKSEATRLELQKPALAMETFELGSNAASSAGKPRPLATGSFTCRENSPLTLEGYVVFEFWKASRGHPPDLAEAPATRPLAIPVRASLPPDERAVGGLRYRGDFIVGLQKKKTNPKVTASFTFQQFVRHPRFKAVFEGDAETAFQLAVPLAQRLEALRQLCRPKDRQAKDVPLAVKWLHYNGLSLLLVPASGKSADLDLIADKLSQLPASDLFSAERDADASAIRLSYAPSPSSGTLSFEFDPGPALGRLAADELSSEGESLHVRPRFIAPNGGHLRLAGKLPPVDGEAELFAATAEDIKSACGGDALELTADGRLPPVSRFGFGDIQVRMGRGRVHTEVHLYGDAHAWQAAGPVLKLEGKDNPVIRGSVTRGQVLSADWELFDKHGTAIPERWDGTLKFSTGLSNPKLVATVPPPVTKEFEVKPSLDEFEHRTDGKVISFLGKATALPTDTDLCVICEQPDDAGHWQEDLHLTGSIRYKIGVIEHNEHFGRCSDTGAFEASLPVRALKGLEGPVRFIWLPRGERRGDAVEVHGVAVQAKSTELSPGELGL